MGTAEGAIQGEGSENLGIVRDEESLARYGLRLGPSQLPTEAEYDAGIAVYAVTEAEVALEAVVPISRLQTREEIEAWEQAEAARVRQASRRGVRIDGKDSRDTTRILGDPISDEAAVALSDEELATMPFARGIGTRPSAEDRARADAALVKDNGQINRRTKRLYN